MRAYAHLLLTAAAFRALQTRSSLDPDPAFVVGALLPDVPLALLSGGFLTWARLTGRRDELTLCGDAYNALYFHNPAWIAGHNAFHAPLLLLGAAAAGAEAEKRGRRWGRSLRWLAAGCGLHTLIDLATHIDDGPLPFFPLNWRRRFRGLISYWDAAHGAARFRKIEAGLSLLAAFTIAAGLLRGSRRSPGQRSTSS